MAKSRSAEMSHAHLSQREAIIRFGRLALQSDNLTEILDVACRLTAEALKTDFAKVMELDEHGRTLLVIAGVGWKKGVVGKERIPALLESSEGYALKTGLPAISEDVAEEERFDYAKFLKRHDVKAIVNVIIPGPEGCPPYGLLQVDSKEPREFGQDDIEFLQGYANLIGAAVERHKAQTELAEALRIQERLFSELQHRINNSLAVIQTLVQMKSGRTAHPIAKQELAEIENQVLVLKEIYKQLYASGKIEQIDLGGYLSSLCAGIANFNDPHRRSIRLETKTETVVVTPDLAVPLGLITNEFVTNSLKHSPKDENLLVSLNMKPGREFLTITLKDNGPGLGDAVKNKDSQETGSGIRLIEGLLRQIQADWTWNSRKGTVLKIEVPLQPHTALLAGE